MSVEVVSDDDVPEEAGDWGAAPGEGAGRHERAPVFRSPAAALEGPFAAGERPSPFAVDPDWVPPVDMQEEQRRAEHEKQLGAFTSTRRHLLWKAVTDDKAHPFSVQVTNTSERKCIRRLSLTTPRPSYTTPAMRSSTVTGLRAGWRWPRQTRRRPPGAGGGATHTHTHAHIHTHTHIHTRTQTHTHTHTHTHAHTHTLGHHSDHLHR
jgi:hypothetical protein